MAIQIPVIYAAGTSEHRPAVAGTDTLDPTLIPINGTLNVTGGLLGVNTAGIAPSFLPANPPTETDDSAIPTRHVGGATQYLGTPAGWITVTTSLGPRAVPCYLIP